MRQQVRFHVLTWNGHGRQGPEIERRNVDINTCFRGYFPRAHRSGFLIECLHLINLDLFSGENHGALSTFEVIWKWPSPILGGTGFLSSFDDVIVIGKRIIEIKKGGLQMGLNSTNLSACLAECRNHLTTELLPFWLTRCRDDQNGGFVTHFDQNGQDTGENEKSLIAQARTVYTMASAHRAGYGEGQCAEYAKHGVDFMIDNMWDSEHGGFFWMVDRQGNVAIDKKILYGLSFAMYALSEYTLATQDPRGADYAIRVFDLIKKHAADTQYGGYWEMFDRNWDLCGPGAGGGDRKTLDTHMHLMEAYTNLYECTGQSLHRRTLFETIELLREQILHPKYATGIPQFWGDWTVAPQIKFNIVWGWDRFAEGGAKSNAEDNTSAGHNVEFAWLLAHATDILNMGWDEYQGVIQKSLDHGRLNGIDPDYGGVYVEGPHAGGVHDMEKEFWQQAEVMIGMLEACLRFGPDPYWDAYENVHRFVFDKGIHHTTGEWWPLLTREGEPIWTHMSHSWKVNYHTVRCMVQCIKRLETLRQTLDQ